MFQTWPGLVLIDKFAGFAIIPLQKFLILGFLLMAWFFAFLAFLVLSVIITRYRHAFLIFQTLTPSLASGSNSSIPILVTHFLFLNFTVVKIIFSTGR